MISKSGHSGQGYTSVISWTFVTTFNVDPDTKQQLSSPPCPPPCPLLCLTNCNKVATRVPLSLSTPANQRHSCCVWKESAHRAVHVLRATCLNDPPRALVSAIKGRSERARCIPGVQNLANILCRSVLRNVPLKKTGEETKKEKMRSKGKDQVRGQTQTVFTAEKKRIPRW